MEEFFRSGRSLRPVSDILNVDSSELHVTGKCKVHLARGEVLDLEAPDAYDLIMQLKPSLFEGQRLKWLRHRWAVHNLIGHPVMQILAFFGQGKLGVKIHDYTIPRPEVKK